MTGAAGGGRGHTPADAFLAHARTRPGDTALVLRDEETSYGRLLDLVTRERERLAALPAAAGEPVGVPAVKSPGTVALVLACLLERRPVLLPAATLGREVLDRLYAGAGVHHVLTPGTAEPASSAPAAEPAPAAAVPAGTALLLTTSGSTGLPKTVPLGAAAITAFTDWAAGHFGIGPGTTVLNYAPLNFDLCLLDVWTTLARGGRVVLVDPDRALQGPYLLDLVTRYAPEVVQAVPMFYRLLADAAREAGGRALPGVRHAVFTGDTVPAPVLEELPRLLPGTRLSNVYGCTETNDSFLHEVTDPAAPVPLGRPLPGVEALVVTADGTVLDGPGTGELYVSTPFQSEGYLGGAGAGAFGPDPRGPGAADGRRWFRSGDLVRRDERGIHTLEGRTDFQVKVRGVRINPQEVEHVLLAHPEVAEAAVLALPDPVAGRLLHAVVRRSAGSALHSLALRGHLARGLPRAAVPSTVRITDEPLPRTSTGKVDRDRVARSLARTSKEN
ncbi:class I adenylate-forming enzyme family protein [Streptomyces sp. NPDC056508]|uniref:class I adenylate-forming enzyme family protein n=1 Tax=Streptomyces sp. NPDC056508 TaxID=3345845 RepID=UPI00368F00B4